MGQRQRLPPELASLYTVNVVDICLLMGAPDATHDQWLDVISLLINAVQEPN
jgi:hypothetical protein